MIVGVPKGANARGSAALLPVEAVRPAPPPRLGLAMEGASPLDKGVTLVLHLVVELTGGECNANHAAKSQRSFRETDL